MITLSILNHKTCKIDGASEDSLKKIRRVLSFRPAGVEFTAAYKYNNWSGITYLINKKNEFPLGLLSNIETHLQYNGELYQIKDLRSPIVSTNPIDITQRLIQLDKVPRDYQQEILIATIQNTKGIIRACTGSGKTLTTALMTARFNTPTNIYVIGLDLLQQFHDLFTQIFDEPIGFIGNGVCEIHRINIISVWTAGRALGIKKVVAEDDEDLKEKDNVNNYLKIQECLKQGKLHIFDECHTVTSETIKSIYGMIDPERIYGLSGTPDRDDGTDLLSNSILGPQIIDIPASRLITAGWLAQPIIKFIKVPKMTMSGGSNYQTIYKQFVSENEVRNSLIIENVKSLLTKNYQVLVLFKHLIHGEMLSELLNNEGVEHEYLSGSDSLDDRIAVKERLLSKQSNLVLASTIFDLGVDISSLSALVLSGSGKSKIRSIQRIGRIIRKFPGKKIAAVIDFYDDVKYLRNHSRARYKTYTSEPGFKIIVPPDLKDSLK